MKKKLFIGVLVGIIGSMMVSSAAYAHNGCCGTQYPYKVYASADENTSHNYIASDSKTVRPKYEDNHGEKNSCGCPWYRRWMRWHQHGCSWDTGYTSNGHRTKVGGCRW